MAIRDEDLLNEGLKAKVAAGAIIGGAALGMIPPPQQTPPQTQQTQQTPAQTPAETAPGTLVQTTPKPPIVAPPVYADKEIREMVMSDEGNKLQKYKDPKGILSIGVGHNLEAPDSEKTFIKAFGAAGKAIRTNCIGGTCLTQEQSEKLFDTDYNSHLQRTVKLIPNLASYPPNVQAAFVSGTYRGHIGDSPTFRKNWNAGNYDAALPEFLNREEYKTPKKNKDGSLVAPGVIIRLERDHKILSDYAASLKPTSTTPTTTSTIKKESYKDKIRMYLREAKGQLPGSDVYFDYGDVFGEKGIMSPKDGVKEPGSRKLIPRLTTTSKYGLPIVQSNGHRIGTDGILSVKSHTNINRKHPKFGQIETHVYDGNTRIATFTSAFNRGAPGMTHTPTNDLFFESDSNSEQSTRRREMDAGSEEFFNRELNKKTAEYDRDDKIRDVIDDHFNETMGGRRNMTIGEFHRTYIEKEFPPPPSDGPGDGSSYGELT
jgi:GH24 family phage-related lysozyme (muramidase)